MILKIIFNLTKKLTRLHFENYVCILSMASIHGITPKEQHKIKVTIYVINAKIRVNEHKSNEMQSCKGWTTPTGSLSSGGTSNAWGQQP